MSRKSYVHNYTFFSSRLLQRCQVFFLQQRYHIGCSYPKVALLHHYLKNFLVQVHTTSPFSQAGVTHTTSNVSSLLCYHVIFYIPSQPTFNTHLLDQKHSLSLHILHNGDTAVQSLWCFTLLVLRACSCAAQIKASIWTFKSEDISQLQVCSASVVFGISLRNCPCIALSFHFLNHFLNSIFLTVSSVPMTPTVFAAINNSSVAFLSYHPELFSSLHIQRSQLISARPPFTLGPYNLSASPFGCSAPFIVIIFRMALSSAFDLPIMPAPYLRTATAQVLITDVLFLPFNFDPNRVSISSCTLW